MEDKEKCEETHEGKKFEEDEEEQEIPDITGVLKRFRIKEPISISRDDEYDVLETKRKEDQWKMRQVSIKRDKSPKWVR